MYRESPTSFADRAAGESPPNSGANGSTGNQVPPTENVIGIDLFAGAGGFSLAALRVGIDIVCAIENDRPAATTYAANLERLDGSEIGVLQDDILSIDPVSVMERFDLKKGRCDIILGGPPCQGFSTHRLKGAGVSDPRNALLARYFEFVATMRPRVFLVENVPGLLWERHRAYLDGFLQAADQHDYDLKGPIVLNARDYGVPQNRKRVFILGIDRTRPIQLEWPPASTHCSPALPDEERSGRIPWNPAAIAFGMGPQGDPNDVHMASGNTLIEAFKKTPPNGGSRRDSGRTLPCHVHHNGHKDVYGRIDPTKPSPTMTTACINPSKGRFVHPTEHHGITLRQAARLQGFPDSFQFHGGLMAGGKQVGNAVPIQLGTALLSSVYRALLAAKLARPSHAREGSLEMPNANCEAD